MELLKKFSVEGVLWNEITETLHIYDFYFALVVAITITSMKFSKTMYHIVVIYLSTFSISA